MLRIRVGAVRGCCNAPLEKSLTRSDRDDDFPSRTSVLDVADGGRNFVQRISPVNHRSDLPRFRNSKSVWLGFIRRFPNFLRPIDSTGPNSRASVSWRLDPPVIV